MPLSNISAGIYYFRERINRGMQLEEIIAPFYPLPESSKKALLAKARTVAFQKGAILMRANRLETVFYFIGRGLVRAYADSANGEVTFWFGMEGSPVLSMKNYILGERSYETMEVLEESVLYAFDHADLSDLYQTDVHLANWGRKLMEYELYKTEERLIAMQFKTAQERYTDLLTQQPELLRRVQLGYIASYLGMSQVSLSRIRADMR